MSGGQLCGGERVTNFLMGFRMSAGLKLHHAGQEIL